MILCENISSFALNIHKFLKADSLHSILLFTLISVNFLFLFVFLIAAKCPHLNIIKNVNILRTKFENHQRSNLEGKDTMDRTQTVSRRYFSEKIKSVEHWAQIMALDGQFFLPPLDHINLKVILANISKICNNFCDLSGLTRQWIGDWA